MHHTCSTCSKPFACLFGTGCGHAKITRTCPSCKPSLWKRCGSCSGQFHDGFCHKCQISVKPVKTFCPACGKKFYTRTVHTTTCLTCSSLPYALVKSLIAERANQHRERQLLACNCNRCARN